MPASTPVFEHIHTEALALDLDLAAHGLDATLRFITLAEPTRDLSRLIDAEPLRDKLPREALTAWVDSASNALPVESPAGRLTGEALATVRRNPILSALFGEMTKNLGKIDGHGLGADALGKAALRQLRAPEATARAISDASPFMAGRLKDHIAEMADAGRDALRDEAPWSKGHDTFLTASQRYAFDLTAWTAAYSKAVEAGAADPIAAADAMISTQAEPGASIGHLLPSFAAYSAKSGNTHLAGQPANAQGLYWLGTLSSALSAARLPETSALRPWLPTASRPPLPPLSTLPASANNHALPSLGTKANKASLGPASLVSALTGMSDSVGSESARQQENQTNGEPEFSFNSNRENSRFVKLQIQEAGDTRVRIEPIELANVTTPPVGSVLHQDALPANDQVKGVNGATLGASTTKNYRKTFFSAHPSLEGKVRVHHAIEQDVLKMYPGILTTSEIHSLENLRGIPNKLNSDLHLSRIRREWNKFYRKNLSVTRELLLEKATEIDNKFGHKFRPPVKYK